MAKPKKDSTSKAHLKEDEVASQQLLQRVSSVKKEEIFYTIMENGMPKKFANMNHPLVCPKKGKVIIEYAKRGPGKHANFSYTRTYDPVNRITYGIPLGVDEKGKIIMKRFYIHDYKEFNLSNPDEAEEWAIFRHHELVANGRYVIYDAEKEAEKEIKHISLIGRAVSIVQDMKIKALVPAARFFGKVPEGMSILTLQSELMNIAKDTPGALIDYWENDNREFIDVFNNAQSVGLIHHDFAKGWLYEKALPLGSTEEQAIRYIRKDAVFCKSLIDKIRGLDSTSRDIINGDQKRKTSFDDINDSDSEDDLLTALRMKAQLLNIQGYENMDIDLLHERVTDAEAIALGTEEEV